MCLKTPPAGRVVVNVRQWDALPASRFCLALDCIPLTNILLHSQPPLRKDCAAAPAHGAQLPRHDVIFPKNYFYLEVFKDSQETAGAPGTIPEGDGVTGRSVDPARRESLRGDPRNGRGSRSGELFPTWKSQSPALGAYHSLTGIPHAFEGAPSSEWYISFPCAGEMLSAMASPLITRQNLYPRRPIIAFEVEVGRRAKAGHYSGGATIRAWFIT